MRYRHLEVDAGTPVSMLGPAALDDLLERGDLGDWAPILKEIRRNPNGEIADRVLRIVEHHPLYGTSPLWRGWILEQRSASSELHAGLALRRLRSHRGLTQGQVAAPLGTTQPEISKLEARRDARLSTLRAYVSALGGTLGLVARFDDNELELK